MYGRKCGKVTDRGYKNSLNMGELWGIPLFSRGYKQVLGLLDKWLASGGKRIWVATVNPEFIMKARQDSQFTNILKEKTSLNVVDGVGLWWALKVRKSNRKAIAGLRFGLDILRGKHRKDIAAGSDLIEGLCQLAAKRGWRVFFLGGWGDRAERTAKNFLSKYPKLKVSGTYEGMATGEDQNILEVIGKDHIDILFVAYGMKKQEEWIDRNIGKISVGVVMGVGRSFDYYSGDLKRAPEYVRKVGMEWLYSLIKEPKRWRRQLALPRFVWQVVCDWKI